MRTRRLLAALALPLALVAACGDEGATTADDPASGSSSSSPAASESAPESASAPASGDASASASPTSASASPTAPPLPACEQVWQAGAKLPGGYAGCLEGDQEVAADGRYCEFGKPLVTYADRFYAVPGGTIAEGTSPLRSDPGYRKVLRTCSG